MKDNLRFSRICFLVCDLQFLSSSFNVNLNLYLQLQDGAWIQALTFTFRNDHFVT